jgi:8-oxo-dGTP diphosphatase
MPYYEYPKPSVTVDAVVFYKSEQAVKILLIQRKKEPFKDLWALPGGFLDMDESLEQAVQRELEEETGVKLGPFYQVGAFGDLGRDPRDRVISVAFYTITQKEETLTASDDAKDASWFDLDDLPQLAFDHDLIIEKAKGMAFGG